MRAQTRFLLLLLATVFVSVFGPSPLAAQTSTQAAQATEIAKLPNVIWGFDFLDDANVLLTTRDGLIHHLHLPTANLRVVSAKPEVVASGQGGLLDLRIRKEADKTWVYLTASMRPTKGPEKDKKSNSTTALLRGEWVGSAKDGDLKTLTRLFEAVPSVNSSLHFGSRLAFHKDGSIFMTLGERNERDRAQKLDQHWGKVLRLTKDGAPFQQSSPVKGALPEIYTYGHRNPQGIAIDSETGSVFVNEHGPRGGDEINLLKPGVNFGWPLTSHGREYWGPKISDKTELPSVEKSLKYYVPSIAPSSMHLYSGKKQPHLKGALLQGALVLQHLNIVPLARKGNEWVLGEERRVFDKLGERIRCVNESPSGELYFGTDSGRFMRFQL